MERRERLRILCRGTVQGVGFRPAVHRLATELSLGGWVRNGPDGVEIEVEGPVSRARAFAERLPAELPPLARLAHCDLREIPAAGAHSFTVHDSLSGRRRSALVPPDAVTCEDCARELADAADRHHLFPFTTCTNCGPRYSLVHTLPYDRPRTSMSCFPLCPDCAREYEDPTDRRFHAEPVSCPACGPRLWTVPANPGDGGHGARSLPTGSESSAASTRSAASSGDTPPGEEPERVPPHPDRRAALDGAAAALDAGRILALKGLGGFQLACRADDDEACRRLRTRKRRPAKPFAIMARDLDTAHALVHLSRADEALLAGPRGPILLAPRRHDAPVSEAIAPGVDDLGVLLPTTPLHRELFRRLRGRTLVMTSGNASDEPICRGNREALERLSSIADLFLLHDRDIVRRVDDSVVRSLARPSCSADTLEDGESAPPVLVRRARGWVPEPVPLPQPAGSPLLAVGGHLQVTVCLAVGEAAFPSPHVGDLDNAAARAFHREVIAELEEFLECTAEHIVVDAHPDYPSARYGEELARQRGIPALAVQHHLAHIAAVLAEHERFPLPGERVGGIALDGTGAGPDGVAWGGEWLELDGDLRWWRRAHLEGVPLVGGERAVREPWRVAVTGLTRSNGADMLPRLPWSAQVPRDRLAEVARLAGRDDDSATLATGAGRLFEAAAAALGLVARSDYEGEGAVRLESLAARCRERVDPWSEVELPDDAAGRAVELPGPELLAAAARRLLAGEEPTRIARGFHETFCHLAVRLSRRRFGSAVSTIALGGGCLVNRFLLGGLARGLRAEGFEILRPVSLPPGDGGLAYGQAALGVTAQARGVEPRWMRGESCV